MPGLAQCNQFSKINGDSCYENGSVSGFWSKNRHDLTYNHLHKFWSELSTQARKDLLRIDKQTLFEKARKNTYCSRCNGLLLECFLQIVMYGKSLPQEGENGSISYFREGAIKNKNKNDLDLTCQDEVHDPSVHVWGGLATTKDGFLTLLDCYLFSKSLKGLQIVFDSARARERERELLYPDACGGGGRGWISQGISGYGRGHGIRETCALHTSRLSVDTLIDFWSALGEETKKSLLRMKEEDFIERLMYRFDSKRFCRDCRRNVIREFKELKELKRMRIEPRCTSWFCAADTAFQYEVSHDSVQADWHETFIDNISKYHHFEWAVGTGDGKSDILEFENVGMSGRVQMSGLDLDGLNSCYITLRAWKKDGRCNEYSVKAHALKGQNCVHCRLVVGDGFVTINRGESIKSFFEHAEEAEEEEDDDSVDRNGNDLDGECSRPQKHAKSPELAREFLLDAATVIFKEQIEKAFKEGTTRQNAHSIFVSLALKLLEERVHVACKEIITLEKQTKLLEEEEKEKREEEERKERKRIKEREKKLRRKERLRGKDKEIEKKSSVCSENPDASIILDNNEYEKENPEINCEEPNIQDGIVSPNIQDEHMLNDFTISEIESHSDEGPDGDFSNLKNDIISYSVDDSKISHRNKPKFQKECWSEIVSEIDASEPRHHCDGLEPYSKNSNGWNKQSRFNNPTKSNARNNGPKFGERYHFCTNRMGDRNDSNSCSGCNNTSKQYYRVSKYNQMDYSRDNSGKPKTKITNSNNISNRDSPQIKQVWEPRSNCDTDVNTENGVSDKIKLSDEISLEELSGQLHESDKDNKIEKIVVKNSKPMSVSSNSDNCSLFLSEGDSNTSSSSSSNPESSSDSEDASQFSKGKEISICGENIFPKFEKNNFEKEEDVEKSKEVPEYSPEKGNFLNEVPRNQAQNIENLQPNVNINSQYRSMVPSTHNPIPFPMYQTPPPSMGSYTNGIMNFRAPSHYYIPSPFEYGMNLDSNFIQHGTHHQHTGPLVNPGQIPIYNPVVRANEINSKDQTVTSKTCGANGSFGKVGMERNDNMTNGKSKKSDEGNSGFSLFHFGSPVALPTENELKNLTIPCKNGVVEGEHVCNNKIIEEYNLFAGSNGLGFSFF